MFTILHIFAHVRNQLNLGDDSMFAITPNRIIVGSLRGTGRKVCNGSTKYRMECHPNGVFDFRKGDTIDFTWGMTEGQVGKLKYAIMENDDHDELRKRTRSNIPWQCHVFSSSQLSQASGSFPIFFTTETCHHWFVYIASVKTTATDLEMYLLIS